jgi:hypothetical protein
MKERRERVKRIKDKAETRIEKKNIVVKHRTRTSDDNEISENNPVKKKDGERDRERNRE